MADPNVPPFSIDLSALQITGVALLEPAVRQPLRLARLFPGRNEVHRNMDTQHINGFASVAGLLRLRTETLQRMPEA